MARPRTFDEERALEAAMQAFWENGYEATSTQDLCEATGLGRSSIYNTFQSKHQLFHRALNRYIETMNTSRNEILEDQGRTGAERLRAMFAALIEESESERERGDGRSKGCLTVNSTVELAGQDPDTAAVLDHDLEVRLAVLRAVLDAGKRDGTITSPRDSDTLARFINAVTGGMRIAGQAGADRADLEAIAATGMDALTL
ncbi:TetR/AcrR family transcriptional regulator [Streptomyces tsukubensis]|uniref:TetR family transcriptional regulator n=1 Tax=Streptomyces tsukubensis TaxID=83656 RepID=A0A1V4AFM1_9ACTN|nr:TetR/AcrR family transcriptional regulator [Streptomyces tsukubensis]OON82530.1 TetR family transcriptional regulator [Streptomyces tsukubensis]QFR92309.1 TetR family transcriptional regulator [Streptomyces tsukubensis]